VLKQPELLRDVLESLRAFRRPLILTLRSRAEGGHLPGGISEMDRLSLFRAGLTEAAVLDVELGADDINHHVVFEAHKRGRAVILSYHNFRKTPTNAALKSLLRKAQRLKGDIVKIAATPHSAADAARFMDVCAAAPARYRVFLAMGPLGRASRLDGFSKGSCLTYGFVRKPVAPGQLSVKEIARAQKRFSK
jgi:3-dehydroquinate dehydratase-1